MIKKRRKRHRVYDNIYGMRPVDGTAARVLGKKRRGSGTRLPSMGSKAVQRALRKMEAAKWRRDNKGR